MSELLESCGKPSTWFPPEGIRRAIWKVRAIIIFTKLFLAVADPLGRKNKVIDDEKSIGDDPSFSSDRFHIDFEDFQKSSKVDPLENFSSNSSSSIMKLWG